MTQTLFNNKINNSYNNIPTIIILIIFALETKLYTYIHM